MKKILAHTLMVILICTSGSSYAQLEAGLNVRTLISQPVSSPDNLIFKYKFAESPLIPRLKLGYLGSYNVNQHLFHKEEDYSNLSYWPSDVEKDGYNQSRSYSITPGMEYRFSQTKTYWYTGIDVAFTYSSFEQIYSWHGEYDNGSTPKYTITNVRQNSNTGTTLNIMPMALFGFGYNITDRLTVFGEALAGPMFAKSNWESEFVYYNWNGLALSFEKQEQAQNDWVIPEPAWQRNTQFNPMLNFYIAYRFTGNTELD